MHSSNIWSIDLPNTNFYLEINRRAIRTIGATYMQYFAKTLLSYTCTACIFFPLIIKNHNPRYIGTIDLQSNNF